jgi:hypothetical protein
MSQSLETAANKWENEGGSQLPPAAFGSQGLLRFLTRNYIADGHVYANLRDAISRTNALDKGGKS